jgi:hypothetical protein
MFYDFQELIHVFMMLQGKTHHVSSSDTLSDTCSSTCSGTRSDTRSSTQYCTKTQGELAVMALATNDGHIGHMGFLHDCPLQLLRSRQLSFNYLKMTIIGLLHFVSYGIIYCIFPNLEVVRPSYGRPLDL